jgi:hypothetical protein
LPELRSNRHELPGRCSDELFKKGAGRSCRNRSSGAVVSPCSLIGLWNRYPVVVPKTAMTTLANSYADRG